jgi:hypothetical protein
MKFRKKPVVIDAWPAVELTRAAEKEWKALPKQIVEAYDRAKIIFESRGKIHIKTLEGTMVSAPGDMIICGVSGELYPCKPDIFEATYEKCES